MSGIKGIVLLTRFDYLEQSYGKEALKKFISTLPDEQRNTLNQPIVLSKEYSEGLLQTVDEHIQDVFFNKRVDPFSKLGVWNARQLVPKYFQLYIDEQNPEKFLRQMERMRDVLIGLGEMHLTRFAPNDFGIRINYGQPFSKAVQLSELSFLEEGCRMCGARELFTEQERSDAFDVEYRIHWAD